jgi:hypothetical protein
LTDTCTGEPEPGSGRGVDVAGLTDVADVTRAGVDALVRGVGVLGVLELVAPGGALLQAAARKASVTSIETILMTGRRVLPVAIFTRSRYVTEMSKPAHLSTPRRSVSG